MTQVQNSLSDLIAEGGKASASTSVGAPAIRNEVGANNILVVGECPVRADIDNNQPFTGNYRPFIESLFSTAGIDFAACSKTYAIRRPAPMGDPTKYCKGGTKSVKLAQGVEAHFANLREFIDQTRPKLIIAMGSVALYALTGEYKISKWRGSQLFHTFSDGTTCRLMPIVSPAIAMKKYDETYLIGNDLRRAVDDARWEVPAYNFILSPTYRTVMDCLEELLALCERGKTRLAVDLETRSGHIACCGIAWSDRDAICIPFMKAFNPNGYWSQLEERNIILKLRELLLHPNSEIETQNGSYDVQYWFRWWQCLALPTFDTMVAHHVCWSGLKKSLDFISALYCRFHQYWKDDGKHFDLEHHDEQQLWAYNCKDCVATFECATELRKLIPSLNLEAPFEFQMKRNLRMVVRMMLRGVRRDEAAQEQLRIDLSEESNKRIRFIEDLVGYPLNPKSPKQVSDLFYGELGQQIVIDRKSKRPTTNDEALTKIGKRTPLLKPVCDAILDYRSIGVLSSTFVGMRPDIDNRFRCSYNIAGPETFRYSSSQNAFNSGGNLQNIPNPKKDKGGDRFKAPNIKRIFIPDEGFEIVDFDLDRADLQVVVWEAGEETLKKLLRAGVDLHLANAQVLFNLPYTVEDLLDPELAQRIEQKYNAYRDFAKAFVHGTNYGGSARTMAIAAHCTVLEAESAQAKWFSTYPGIKDWHRRIEMQLMQERCVYNKFGFRRYYFERIEGLLPEALAWVPQSTVAITIDKGMCNVDENLAHLNCQPLLQVHDSGVFQYPADNRDVCLREMKREMEIVIPYDDPLIIPVGAKISASSWGDCKSYAFA